MGQRRWAGPRVADVEACPDVEIGAIQSAAQAVSRCQSSSGVSLRIVEISRCHRVLSPHDSINPHLECMVRADPLPTVCRRGTAKAS